MASRLIDPVRHIERAADAQSGVLTPREVANRQDQASRINAEPDRNQRYLIFETIEFYMYDMTANDTLAMFQLFITSGATVSLTASSPDISTQCRVCGLRILANGAGVTAGTIVPVLRVTEGADTTDYTINELELNTTDTRRKSWIFPWEQAIQIAKDATFLLLLTTSAAYAATTLDYKVHITLGYDQWV